MTTPGDPPADPPRRPLGFHWAASLRHAPRYLNIPYAPHKILVIGWGRLAADATMRPNQPCCYRMHLHHCCPEAPPP